MSFHPIVPNGKREAETHAMSRELKIAPVPILPVILWSHQEHTVDIENKGTIAQMNSTKKPRKPGNNLRFSEYIGMY